jgi:tetratricopeptide (TPR) repeat protein
VALLAYSNSFGAALIYDNEALILHDARIQAATSQNVRLILNQHYWFGNGESDLYRPLTTLSYLFNYAILGGGSQPAGYHWVNFALHAVNIALVYLLALWILHEIPAAWLMAAVWAVHPVLTESVTNVVGRADLLAAFAVLAGLACHVRASAASGRRRVLWLTSLALVVALGMFSKESAIVVLGAMALYDVAFGALGAPGGKPRWRIANYLAAAVPCLVYLYIRGGVVSKSLFFFTPFTDNPLAGTDFWTARLTAVKVIGKYLALLVWPGALSCDYSYNQIPLFTWRLAGGEPWKLLAALLACAALGVAAVRSFRGERRVFFFVLLFFVTLAPTSNVFLIVGTIMGERFLYLPSIAFAGCLAIGVPALWRRLPVEWPPARFAVPAILAAIILALGVRTYVRNFDWASEGALMTSIEASAPDSYKSHMVLATILVDRRRAVAEADRTRAILDGLPDEKNLPKAYVNAGICYREQGEWAASQDAGNGPLARSQSEPWYQRSLEALLRARSIEQTLDRICRRESLRRGKGNNDFGWFPVYLELGRTYLRLSQPREALDALQHGQLLDFRPPVFVETSAAYDSLGDSRQAAIALMEGLSIDTSQTQLAAKLVELYQRTEPRSCAVRETGGLRAVDMDCPLVKEHLCAALAKVSRLYAEVGKSQDARAAGLARSGMGCPAE